MIPMKPSPQIVKFMAPGSGFQALGWGQYSYIPVVKMYENFKKLTLKKTTFLLPFIFEEN